MEINILLLQLFEKLKESVQIVEFFICYKVLFSEFQNVQNTLVCQKRICPSHTKNRIQNKQITQNNPEQQVSYFYFPLQEVHVHEL